MIAGVERSAGRAALRPGFKNRGIQGTKVPSITIGTSGERNLSNRHCPLVSGRGIDGKSTTPAAFGRSFFSNRQTLQSTTLGADCGGGTSACARCIPRARTVPVLSSAAWAERRWVLSGTRPSSRCGDHPRRSRINLEFSSLIAVPVVVQQPLHPRSENDPANDIWKGHREDHQVREIDDIFQ